MDRAGGDDELVAGWERRHDLPYGREEFALREPPRIRLDLQGTDARGEVRDSVKGGVRHRLHQRVHPHAQGQIQLHGAEFDQQVVVAAAPVRHVAVAREYAAVDDRGPRRAVVGDRREADRVTGPKLPELPALRADDRRGADEAAERGAVRAEQHRHVAGVVDGAHRVGRVVDVGRVQARLAAVLACPAGLRTDQPYARACRVEVDLPVGGVELVDVLLGEELRCGVRAFERADVPVRREDRSVGSRHRSTGDHRAPVQHISRPQRPPAVPAEPAEREGGRAAQERGHVQAAAREEHVCAQTVLGGGADLQDGPSRHRDRLPLRDRRTVQGDRRRSTRHADGRGVCEAQGRSLERALQTGCPLVVAEGPVAEPEGQVVHRAARRHPDLPVAGAAGPVLDGGERAARDDLDARCRIGDLGERRRRMRRGAEGAVRQRRAHQSEVRLDAVDAGPGQRLVESFQRVGAVRAVGDDLREHGVVRSRDLGPRLHPAVHADAAGEFDARQQARAGPVFARGVLGVHPCLDGVAAGRSRVPYDIGLAARQSQHPGDEVDPVDLLGDRMLHLKTGVDLQEVRLLAGGVVHELDGSGRAVVDRRAQVTCRGGKLIAYGGGESGGGSLFQYFLVAALERAVAVAEGDHTAPAVAEDLHLHMAGLLHQPFQEHPGGGEGGRGDALHALPGLGQFIG